jgi:hypothetical protein
MVDRVQQSPTNALKKTNKGVLLVGLWTAQTYSKCTDSSAMLKKKKKISVRWVRHPKFNSADDMMTSMTSLFVSIVWLVEKTRNLR